MQVAQVVETKMAYKSGETDEDGNTLPLGTIQVRTGGGSSNLGQVQNFYARPAWFTARRVPLINEQVLIFTAPANEDHNTHVKGVKYYYIDPLNSTDDLVLHMLPRLWVRRTTAGSKGSGGGNLADKDIPGRTFPKSPKKVSNLQIYEGDVIYEGRFGQSIRFGSTVTNASIYEKRVPWKGGKDGDPITVLQNRKPQGEGSSYEIEDPSKKVSTIYLTTTQAVPKIKPGFKKNRDAAKIPKYSSTPQAMISAGRVVINSTDDISFLVGSKRSVVTAKEVMLQSQQHKVDLDDLMNYIKDVTGELFKLVTAQKQFATAAGPTGVATNMSDVTKLYNADFNKLFKTP